MIYRRVFLAALGLISALPASAANIKITSLPFNITQPGTYVLASNLVFPSGAGTGAVNSSGTGTGAINISVNLPGPVVVNFKGYSITDSAAQNGDFGVVISGTGPSTSAITVENGSLNGFYFDCLVEPSNGTLLNNITLDNLAISNTPSQSGAGVNLIYAQDVVVTNCSFTNCATAIETDRTASGDRFSTITFTNCGTSLAMEAPGVLDTLRFEPPQ
jgi:hypothetical protein